MDADSLIVKEVRERRMEISERYDHNLDKYAEHLRQIEAEFPDRLVSQVTVVPAGPEKAQGSS